MEHPEDKIMKCIETGKPQEITFIPRGYGDEPKTYEITTETVKQIVKKETDGDFHKFCIDHAEVVDTGQSL